MSDDTETYTITIHRSEFIPGGNGARIGYSDDHPDLMLLFIPKPAPGQDFEDRIMSTPPVRLFCWAMVAVVILFFVAWYLEEYYVPLLWKNQP